MKRFIRFLFFILLILGIEVVKAETFVEGNYLSGEYISKKKDGKIHYLTLQYLKDSSGSIVYCLEPYTKFAEGKSNTSYEGDISGYGDLTEAQKRKISLIVYYGYGYSGRTTSKWYAVTQYLIWDTVTGSNGSVYFTDKLNGNKITKYTNEINNVLSDVNSHDIKPSFIHDYDVDYEKDIFIDRNDYEVMSSDFEYEYSKGILLKNIKNNGKVSISKISDYYDRKVAIFDSTSSQDLIRPGNVINPKYNLNIKVKKGTITLDIDKDDDIYTVESDFSNTCYDIYKDGTIIDSVCTNNEELIYKTSDLAYGEYEVKQKSNGIGYRKDNNVYQVRIDDSNPDPIVNLHNLLIRNDIRIKKYACKKQDCVFESDALFELFDSKGNLVNSLVTDASGEAKIQVGYGSYKIKQVNGLTGYTLVDEYSERIVDEESNHEKELINNYIEVKKEIKISETPEEKREEDIEVEEVPNTKTDGNFFQRLLAFIIQFFNSIFNKIDN